ncbi:hypothetical protein VIGAN_06192200, partial [Vigna angularis var. angularis]
MSRAGQNYGELNNVITIYIVYSDKCAVNDKVSVFPALGLQMLSCLPKTFNPSSPVRQLHYNTCQCLYSDHIITINMFTFILHC